MHTPHELIPPENIHKLLLGEPQAVGKDNSVQIGFLVGGSCSKCEKENQQQLQILCIGFFKLVCLEDNMK